MGVSRLLNELRHKLVGAMRAQLAYIYIDFIVGWTCSFVNPSEVLGLFAGFPQHCSVSHELECSLGWLHFSGTFAQRAFGQLWSALRRREVAFLPPCYGRLLGPEDVAKFQTNGFSHLLMKYLQDCTGSVLEITHGKGVFVDTDLG